MLRCWTWPSRVSAPLVLAVALLAAPLAAAAAEAMPFRAAFAEQFGLAACPPNTPQGMLCASATGIGSATGIVPGPVVESVLGVVDLNQANRATGCAPDNSTGTLTNANGDLVHVTTTGTFCPTGKHTAIDSGTFTISGGTGSLEGITAQGTFVTHAVILSGFSGRSASTYRGTISIPDQN